MITLFSTPSPIAIAVANQTSLHIAFLLIGLISKATCQMPGDLRSEEKWTETEIQIQMKQN